MALHVNLSELAVLFSILLRLSIILFMLPVFSTVPVPSAVKVCICVALALMFMPAVRGTTPPLPLDASRLIPVVMGELFFGAVFALSLVLVFGAFQVAGELISFEMGFGFAQVADPETGAEVPVLGIWCELTAMMIFLGLNGHHAVLRVFAESFKTLPVGTFTIDPALYGRVLSLSASLFVLAIKLAAPVMAVLLLIQLGFGLMAKFAPQLNVLTTSFPVTIAVGFLFLGLAVLLWGDLAGRFFAETFLHLGKMISG